MEFLALFGFIIVIFTPVCWLWMRGFDYMDKYHPNYTGDDLFSLDEDDKTQIG